MNDHQRDAQRQAGRTAIGARVALIRAFFRDVGYVLLGLLVLLGVWQLVVVVFQIPEYNVPAPYPVMKLVLVDERHELFIATLETAREAVLGAGLAIVVGVGSAVVIVSSRIAARTIYPMIVWSQVVPKVALAPLFIIWFGFGAFPKILTAFLISFFPITISTVAGLMASDREFLVLSRSMGGSKLAEFFKIRMPGTAPYFFTGLKVSITFAVVGAVVGEFIGADRGLGYTLVLATSQLETPRAFASIFLMSALGMVLYGAVELIERLTIPWHHEQQLLETSMRASL